MRKGTVEYEKTLAEATAWLFDEFLRWNEIQGELKVKGYENDYYGDGEVARERCAFRAIAERFVLEDVDFRIWQWFETPWAGVDANTGMEACIVDFAMADGSDEAGSGVLGFYVTRDSHFWYARPLAEMPAAGGGLTVCQANCIQDAINALKLVAVPAGAGSETDSSHEAED